MTKAERANPEGTRLMKPLPAWVSIGSAVYRLPELQAEIRGSIESARVSALNYRRQTGDDRVEFEISDGFHLETGIFRFGLGSIGFSDNGNIYAAVSNDIEEARLWLIGNEPDDAAAIARLKRQIRELADDAKFFAHSRLFDLWRDGLVKLFGRLDSEAAPFMEVPKTLLGRSEIDRSTGILKAATSGETFFSLHVEPIPVVVARKESGDTDEKAMVRWMLEAWERDKTILSNETLGGLLITHFGGKGGVRRVEESGQKRTETGSA